VDQEISLSHIKDCWNDVLDTLERRDRIAWLAFFDARLAGFRNGVLDLDFSDSRKFGAAHEYSESRQKHCIALIESIQEEIGIKVSINELR
jgi:hypothetical protein